MITDIVPLTISATTMFVQVQSGELLVRESRMFAVHSTATGLRLGLQRSKSVWISNRQVPDTFPDSLLPHSAVVRLKRHKVKARRFVAAFRKQNVSHGGSLVNRNTNPEGESLQDGMKAEVAAFPSTGTVTTIVVPC
jgi:hypothetical protein